MANMFTLKMTLIVGVAIPTVFAGSPWANTPAVKTAKLLVSQMSLDEKISMIYGRNVEPKVPSSVYYVGNVPGTPRLKLPPLSLEDGPQGVADKLMNVTQWPSQLTVSMAWSDNLMNTWGNAMGVEQKAKGTNVMLGPDVNLARVPWSGRVFETMGEDPFLASSLVVPLIKGIQQNNISACVKHFIFNNHECNRQTFSANVAQRVGRELYAPAFLAAVDAGVGSVMCAFNRVNNTFACENEGSLNKLLKNDGGFRGWVVTDWGAQHDSILSANSGLDQEMEWDQDANKTRYGTIGFENAQFREAITNGTVPMSRLDNMVTRMVEPMLALGLVGDAPDSTIQNTSASVQSLSHFALAAEIAQKSLCMLKNKDSILPLKKKTSVAVFGNMYFRAGKGSGGVQYASVPSMQLYDACVLPHCNPNTAFLSQVLVNNGFNVTVGHDNAQAGIQPFYFNATKAAEEAAAAEYAIVVVYSITGEGMDRTNLSLDDWQNEMVSVVAKANPRTIVVARCSGAFVMPWLDDVEAVLYQLIPGQAAGMGAASVIIGDINPSGKLTVSFPTSMDETWLGTPLNPAQYPGTVRNNTWQEADYSEGLEVGYKWYDSQSTHKPLFEFGFGLSFTTFSYSELVCESSTVTFKLKNSGLVIGTEIVQVYIGFPTEAASPLKQLKGYARVEDLKPSSETSVSIAISAESLTVWSDVKHMFVSVPGTYTVFVGSSATDIRLKGSFSM
eukprot:m.140041 g.140041  ORF g.140041 m.140041 type:complete len:728 (+) comp30098_c2_seq1:32-2215(+)